MTDIYKPKKGDVFKVAVFAEEFPDKERIMAYMFVKSFTHGVPDLTCIGGDTSAFKAELTYDIIKDQLTEGSNNHYTCICHTDEKEPMLALKLAEETSPEYFI